MTRFRVEIIYEFQRFNLHNRHKINIIKKDCGGDVRSLCVLDSKEVISGKTLVRTTLYKKVLTSAGESR